MDLAIGISGTSLSAQDVLKALMEESDLGRTAQSSGEEEEVPASPSTAPSSSATTDERLTALEQSTSDQNAAILDRLARMEKQLKKSARRSAKEGPAVDAERDAEESRCDCAAQKKYIREQRERMEVEAKGKEDDLVSCAEQAHSVP